MKRRVQSTLDMIRRESSFSSFFVLLLIRKQNSDYFIAQQLFAPYETSSGFVCDCAAEAGEREENSFAGKLACARHTKDDLNKRLREGKNLGYRGNVSRMLEKLITSVLQNGQ